MKTARIVTNGAARTFEYKLWGDGECRVYQVFGDVTNRDELAEAMQELAILCGAETVKLNF
jgi:hypothetical protein